MVPLLGSFWINVVLPLVIYLGMCALCRHLFISSACLSWMEVNFLNQKPCIASWPVVFQLDIFFRIIFSKSICISAFRPSLSPSNSLVIVYSFSLFVGFFWLPYFSPELFSFFCIWLFALFPIISSQLLIEFSFIVLECPVLPVLFTLCRYLFNLLSFTSTFWFISLSCIVIFSFFLLSCIAFSFLFRHIPVSFHCFIILACFRRFFICISSWISPPGFDFSFVLFEGMPIFTQTNFAPV